MLGANSRNPDIDGIPSGLALAQHRGDRRNVTVPSDSSLPSVLSTPGSVDKGLSSSDSAEEVKGPSPRGRKLKLKVSRGALAKGRRRKGGTSHTSSSNSGSSLSEPLHEEPSGGQPAKQHPQARKENDLPTAPADILALFSSNGNNGIHGKALRRLTRRFPDLEARLAEVQLPSPERAATADVSRQDSSVETLGTGGTRRLYSGRLRGRVFMWMRSAGQAIARARARSKGRE